MPKDYVYILPEGYTMKPDSRAKLDAVVTKLGLTNEQAQELINLHVELTEEFAATYEAALKPVCAAIAIIFSAVGALVASLLFVFIF